ncbi:heterokaryon incompatibility protein-domain-containing protein, partial [Phaeosphaeriaceae sp. PMI808]
NMESQPYKHGPLDHSKESLRPVHLLPELSNDGHIQWGNQEISPIGILINGKLFFIHRNLFDFLETMRLLASQGDAIFDSDVGYWIDALCIDQNNTSERNHQVAQMGSIFSQADHVHIWLGATPDAARICKLLDGPGPMEGTELEEWASLMARDWNIIDRYIFRNEYWNRAWVTQEIVLAKRVKISFAARKYGFMYLVKWYYRFWSPKVDTDFSQFAEYYEGKVQIYGQSLIHLMSHFQDKGCSLSHDRVYSLLSLCRRDEKVAVDYDMSSKELAWKILLSTRETA